MSKAAPLIVMLLLVGGIVLWGALTDWTFSGLLPREGARCTPGDDEKVENAKQYVYDEDNECTVIQSCETNWKPNSSNTACISSSTGEPCEVSNPVPKGVYTFNTRGVCTMGSCITGYQKSGAGCISTLTGEPCDGPDEYAVYKHDTDGECVFDSCTEGYENSDTGCVEIETCDPTTTEYDETQVGKCLGEDNEIVDCEHREFEQYRDVSQDDPNYESGQKYNNSFQSITFKSGCGTKNIVYPDYVLGIGRGCQLPETVQGHCNDTPGCIGYKTSGSRCSRLILNTDVLPASIPNVSEPWNIDSVGDYSTGFRAVRGTINSGDVPGYISLITKSDGERPATIQECFDNASENAKVIGIRTDEHGNEGYKNTCWEYGDGYQDYITNEDDLIGKDSHLLVCRDPTRDIMNKEC